MSADSILNWRSVRPAADRWHCAPPDKWRSCCFHIARLKFNQFAYLYRIYIAFTSHSIESETNWTGDRSNGGRNGVRPTLIDADCSDSSFRWKPSVADQLNWLIPAPSHRLSNNSITPACFIDIHGLCHPFKRPPLSNHVSNSIAESGLRINW